MRLCRCLYAHTLSGGFIITTTTREELAAQRSGAQQFAVAAAELAANTRCENVVIFDLRGRSPVTEFFVIATGTSPRQMRTVVDELQDLGKKTGFAAWQTNGYDSARWIVLDCVNVVVHVFDVESRDFYDLDLLWGDSPRIDWRKELGLPEESERPARPPTARPDEVEDEDGFEGPDAQDDQDDDDATVVVEVPDESTGSNSVEFVEIDAPNKRGQRGRVLYPSTVDEAEDSTEEERAMGPMSEAGEAVEEEEDEEVIVRAARPAKKKAVKKAKAVAKPKKKPLAKTAKAKPVKKPVATKKAAKSKPAAKKKVAKAKPAAKKRKKA